MIIEDFIKDEGRLSALRIAIGNLSAINAFGLFLEIGTGRSRALPTNHPIEHAALRASWFEGYASALDDIYSFFDKYLIKEKQKPRSDFSAAEQLLKEKTIDEEEYEQLTGAKPAAD